VSAAMAAGVAAAVAAASLVPGRSGLRRLAMPRGSRLSMLDRWQTRSVPASAARVHRLAGAAAGVGLVLVLGLPWGLLPGVGALVVVPVVLGRLESADVRRRRERIVADLPLAVDLLAACMRAGGPPGDALVLVADAVGGPLGGLFVEVAQRLRLGADPADAWVVLAAEPATSPLGRAVLRATVSGGPPARTLEQLGSDVRRRRNWAADERARAVETRAVVPLGLCFLPAFVLIGIVPTIAGSLSGLVGVLGG
jgi:Flp pilus assembly protein TadB